jgi:hypothetical protein
MIKEIPSPEMLRKMLRYEPETGKLFWKQSSDRKKEWNTRYSGKEAFTRPHRMGYLQGTIFNRTYLAHRVIWTIVNGRWPEKHIDHIDGDKTNNKIKNLREATISQNLCNRGANSNGTSGYKGVSFHKKNLNWCAYITLNRKRKFLGSFDTPQKAHKAYCEAALKMHGDFAKTE